jgi:hypothetical protein
MKRYCLVIYVSDHVLDEMGAVDTGEDAVAAAASSLGLVVEEIEGLDWWPDSWVTSGQFIKSRHYGSSWSIHKFRRQSMKPKISRMVIYRSRTGDYDCPAVIAATRDTLHIPNVEAGFIPPLSSEDHVHLVVFSAGSPGKRAAPEAHFLVESPHGRSENVSGSYQEWDITYDPEGAPGTWRWPEQD